MNTTRCPENSEEIDEVARAVEDHSEGQNDDVDSKIATLRCQPARSPPTV